MKTIKTPIAIGAIAILLNSAAFAGIKADIHVMTQNQYLGADVGMILRLAKTIAAVITNMTPEYFLPQG